MTARFNLRSAQSLITFLKSALSRASVIASTVFLLPECSIAYAQNGGAADTTFNGTGQATVQLFGLYDRAYDVVVQPDGRILAVGDGHDKLSVLRFNADGTRDLSFASNGEFVFDNGRGLWAKLHLKEDGRILVGFAGAFGRGMSVLCLQSNGALVTTFGINGEANARWGSYVTGIVVQPDGRIVVAGHAYFSGTNYDFTLARFSPDGLVDTTFGTNGRVITDFTRPAISFPDDKLNALVLLPDGSLVAAGETRAPSGITGTYYALAKYDANGQLDSRFGQGGQSVFTFYAAGQPWSSETISDLAVLADGRLLGVGCGGITGGALLRILPDGSPDPCFGQNGLVLTRLGTGNDWYSAMTLDRYGRILAFGTQVNNQTGAQKPTLVRYWPDGTLDSTFGTGGMAATTAGGAYDYGEALTLSQDGRIVIAGSSSNNFMVGRRLPGTPPNQYTLQLSPVDGLASTNNGKHWSITDGDISVNVYRSGNAERRGIFEFPLESIPVDAHINSARLNMYIGTYTYSGTTYPNVQFYGYAGNGSLEPADAAVSTQLVTETGAVMALGAISMNLDAAYLGSLLALPSPWIGLTAYQSVEGRQTGFFTVENPIGGTAPFLTVEYLRPILKLDFDQDHDVDVDDFAFFESCVSGAGLTPDPCCRDKDLDADGDVDMTDFARFQRCYSLPGEVLDSQCVTW